MSQPYFMADLHLDHQNILKFGGKFRSGSTIEEHNQILIDNINRTCNKRATLYLLGDICFSPNSILMLQDIKCKVKLLRGNHDKYLLDSYLAVVDEVIGFQKYKQYWLSHAPIHPQELRGKLNVHGHVHHNSILDADGQVDPRYINVSVEAVGGIPVSLTQIRNGDYERLRKC